MELDNRSIAALLATATISFAPSVILTLFPNFNQVDGSVFFTLGKCLAAGGLLGDVFLHVLPHASGGGEHAGEEVGQMLLVGFSVFMMFDMFVRTVNGNGSSCKHSHADHNGNGYSNGTSSLAMKKNWTDLFSSSTVLLNLVADSLHNFTDGLTIGASFGASSYSDKASVFSVIQSSGGIASISVLVHEIPHELGDFSILMSEGFSKWQAITLQAVTAIAAFMGTCFGLVVTQGGHGMEDALMPFTAGGFVYLACCNILPEILEDNGKCYKRRIYQLAAFFTGIAFLYAVSILEHAEGGCGHGHSHDSHHHDHHEHDHHEHHDHDHHDHDHDHEL